MAQDMFNLPLAAPALRLPPYRYNHVRRVSIILETDPDRLARFIPAPLEPISNQYVVWMEHRVDQNPGPAPEYFHHPFDTYEASVDIPVRFRGEEGTHIPLMWVPTTEADFSRALAGRELQGIGKKLAHFSWDERVIDNEIVARMTRNSIDVINIHGRLTDEEPPTLPTKTPVINIKVLPRIDGTGYDLRKVVALDTWEVNTIAARAVEVLDISFGESPEDPVYELAPTRIVGGVFTVWSGSVENPCGRELADLLKEGE
jgi:acetoacetate decarboxylase